MSVVKAWGLISLAVFAFGTTAAMVIALIPCFQTWWKEVTGNEEATETGEGEKSSMDNFVDWVFRPLAKIMLVSGASMLLWCAYKAVSYALWKT